MQETSKRYWLDKRPAAMWRSRAAHQDNRHAIYLMDRRAGIKPVALFYDDKLAARVATTFNVRDEEQCN